MKGWNNDERKDIYAFAFYTELESTVCFSEWKALIREVLLCPKCGRKQPGSLVGCSMGWGTPRGAFRGEN